MIINADEHDFVQCLKDKCTEGDEPHYKLLWDFYESSELSWTELMNIEDYWNFYDSWEEYVGTKYLVTVKKIIKILAAIV